MDDRTTLFERLEQLHRDAAQRAGQTFGPEALWAACLASDLAELLVAYHPAVVRSPCPTP